MSYNYLKTFNKQITQSQRTELARVIDAKIKMGEIDSSTFASNLEEALAKIDPDNKPIIKLKLVESSITTPKKISSEEYNTTINEAHIDLTTLFNESNLTADVISRHEQIGKDFTNSLKRKIKLLRSKINEYKTAAENTEGFSSILEETFIKTSGQSKNTLISDGALRLATIPGFPIVYNAGPIIQKVQVVRYPKENTYNSVIYASTPDHDLELNYNSTQSPKKHRQNRDIQATRNMLRSGTTYGVWAEVALANVPISQIIDGTHYFGVAAMLRITYNGTHDINKINIDPYSDAEIIIPRIRYKTVLGEWTLLTGLNEYNHVAPIAGKGIGLITLEGFDVLEQIKELEIMFFQPTSTLQRFILNENELQDIALWDELLENEYEKLQHEYHTEVDDVIVKHRDDPTLTEKPVKGSTFDKSVVKLQSAQGVNEMLKTAQDALNLSAKQIDTVSQTLTGEPDTTYKTQKNAPKLVEFHKHEYVYGAYSVSPQITKYTSASGTWISPLYDTQENIVTQVGLDVTQVLPSGTTIAFSIIDAEKRAEIPILPSNIDHIYEHISNARIEASGIGTVEWETRFPASSGTIQLLVDNETVPATNAIYNVKYYESNEKTIGTRILASGVPLSSSSRYSLVCEYTPERNSNYLGKYQSNPHTINLLPALSPISVTESNAEDLTINEYELNLKHYPFVDYSRFNYNAGVDSDISHITGGGDFIVDSFPFQSNYGDWIYLHYIKDLFGVWSPDQQFISDPAIIYPHTFWNITQYTNREWPTSPNRTTGKLSSFVLNETSIRLLRLKGINTNFKYAITRLAQDPLAEPNPNRYLYIGFYNPEQGGIENLDKGWIDIIKFSWLIIDQDSHPVSPERDTIYEQNVNVLTPAQNALAGLTHASCKINLDWGELFTGEFPIPLPEPDSYELITVGQQRESRPVYNDTKLNRLHPLSGYISDPHTLPSEANPAGLLQRGQYNPADPIDLRSTVFLWLDNVDLIPLPGHLGRPSSGVIDAPDSRIADLSTCELLHEVVTDSIWTDMEFFGWNEQLKPSGWLRQAQNIFKPIRLFVDKEIAIDKTSYKKTEEQDALDSYDLTNEYQFYLYNNTLYTNFDFTTDPDKTVEVTYSYLTDGLRLKAELHNNQFGPSYFTPILKDYKLKLRSRS